MSASVQFGDHVSGDAVKSALARLDRERADLVLVSTKPVDLPTAWSKAEQLVKDGRAAQLGVDGSNWSCSSDEALATVQKLLESSVVKPACLMTELHPLHSQRKLVGTLLRKVRFVAARSWQRAAAGYRAGQAPLDTLHLPVLSAAASCVATQSASFEWLLG
jgi:diketogulonate reductase-like aldo/keto reductase